MDSDRVRPTQPTMDMRGREARRADHRRGLHYLKRILDAMNIFHEPGLYRHFTLLLTDLD